MPCLSDTLSIVGTQARRLLLERTEPRGRKVCRKQRRFVSQGSRCGSTSSSRIKVFEMNRTLPWLSLLLLIFFTQTIDAFLFLFFFRLLVSFAFGLLLDSFLLLLVLLLFLLLSQSLLSQIFFDSRLVDKRVRMWWLCINSCFAVASTPRFLGFPS